MARNQHNPSTYGCASCNTTYIMGAETRISLFTRQPWFNHLETTCPNCGTEWSIWYLTDGAIAYLQANNMVAGDEIEWSVKEFAARPVVIAFCEATGHPYATDRKIGKREAARYDNQCAFFAYLLDQLEEGALPDE